MDYSRLDVPLFCDSQSMKDCKKSTPDYVAPNKDKGVLQVGYTANDVVMLYGAVSLVDKSVHTGEYVFESYDKYDNTCFVYKLNGTSGMKWNILLSDLTLPEKPSPIKL